RNRCASLARRHSSMPAPRRNTRPEHITGAVHLPPGQPAGPLLPRLSAAPAVIVYDRDRDCAAADRVAVLLQSNGVRDVRVLTGAWPEWLARGGPGESGTCALCAAGGQ